MNNKIIRMLVPVIAVMIILESIVLVSSLEKSTTVVTVVDKITPTVIEVKKINSFDIGFLTDETQMKIGKKYKVSVKLTPKENYNLDALDLYVKFDPVMVNISNLVSSKDLMTPNLIKVSDKKDVIVTNYLFTDKDGAVFTKDEETVLLTFSVTPKVVGLSSFEVSTGDSEDNSVTMFVDKNTNSELFFTSSKLDVEFIK